MYLVLNQSMHCGILHRPQVVRNTLCVSVASLEQLQAADKQLWLMISDQCRTGVRLTAAGYPFADALDKIINMAEFRFFLVRLPSGAKSASSRSADVPLKPAAPAVASSSELNKLKNVVQSLEQRNNALTKQVQAKRQRQEWWSAERAQGPWPEGQRQGQGQEQRLQAIQEEALQVLRRGDVLAHGRGRWRGLSHGAARGLLKRRRGGPRLSTGWPA